jgi:hypothetical protein
VAGAGSGGAFGFALPKPLDCEFATPQEFWLSVVRSLQSLSHSSLELC